MNATENRENSTEALLRRREMMRNEVCHSINKRYVGMLLLYLYSTKIEKPIKLTKKCIYTPFKYPTLPLNSRQWFEQQKIMSHVANCPYREDNFI